MSLTLTTAAIVAILNTQSNEPRLIRFPDVKGDAVVFTYAGDLWISQLSGGLARRLTTHPGLETRARFSPDGKWIAFTGEYDGNQEVYVIPVEGGEPRRLTYEPDIDEVIGWTPDGHVMYTSTAGGFSNKQRALYLAHPNGGLPKKTPIMDISEGSMTSDGRTVAYTRGRSHLFNWRKYRGGTQGRVSLYDMKANAYRELPSGREQTYFPMAVGDSLYYISDKKLGTLNLYRYDLKANRETQLTKYTDADIRFPSTDGKTMVFERDGYLNAYDLSSGSVRRLNPDIRSDLVATRSRLRDLSNQITSMDFSPSGVRVVVEARGDVFSVPARTGETRNMTRSSGSRERSPSWSPDGRRIAYLSDASGNYEIWMQPQEGGEAAQLTNAALPLTSIEWSPNGKHLLARSESNEMFLVDVESKEIKRVYRARLGLGGGVFSPDGRWIAYLDQDENSLNSVWIYEVASGKSTRVTERSYSEGSVVWDLTGRYLYLVSSRTFAPSSGLFEFSLKVDNAERIYALPLTKDTPNPVVPQNDEEPTRPSGPPQAAGGPQAPGAPSGPPEVKIDFEGIIERLVPLPSPPGSYSLLAGQVNGFLFRQGSTISRYDHVGREPVAVISGVIGPATTNYAGTKLAYYQGGTLGVVDVRPGNQAGQGRVSLADVQTVVDPRSEWRQIFWDAWRYQRDNFYDPAMRGLDWKAVGDRYAAYLPYVAHRSDLNYVIGLMIGELGTGHAYVSGGDDGAAPGTPVGQLGVEYEVSGNHVRIARILEGDNFDESRRSPLSEPGVDARKGDYVLAIDGVPVDKDVNPNSLLVGKAGRTVVLTLNDTPNTTGARRVRVRALASETGLRYADFVARTRRRVEEASGGRIGYFHVPDTQLSGATEFIRGYYANTDKDALIVDDRWNNGGFIQPWFVDTLARRTRSRIQSRNQDDWSDAVSIEGPKAMLINGYAGSGGDFFPYMFRQSKLGPLVGTRTWGGLVGISGNLSFVDGGTVSSPEFSLTNPETNEIIAENVGIDPDIEVDARPDLIAQGRDPQLEKAIEHLMEQLRRMPPKKKRTELPRLAPKGRVDN